MFYFGIDFGQDVLGTRTSCGPVAARMLGIPRSGLSRIDYR